MCLHLPIVLKGSEIWLAFSHSKNFRYIAALTIAAELGDDWCKGLLFMHIFSGCNTVCGIGKKTVWRSLPSLTTLFGCLLHNPEAITDNYMEEIERFFVFIIQPYFTVNAGRKQLFSYGNRKLENLPSRAALYQHVKCASFQAGYIWEQVLIANPSLVIGVGRRMQMENGHHYDNPFRSFETMQRTRQM